MEQNETSAFHEDIDAKIIEFGFTVIGVFDDKNPRCPRENFMYTVGLSRFQLPEIILSGFHKVFHPMINKLGKMAMDSGSMPMGLVDLGYLIAGSDEETSRLFVQPVSNNITIANEKALSVRRRYPNPQFVQLLWSDTVNILPNEYAYDNLKCPQEIF